MGKQTMIFNKINASNKKVTTTSNGGSGGGSSYNTSYGNYSSNDIERFLWGQWDNGGDSDINGTMYVNGNIFLTSEEIGRYDDEDEEDDENRDYGEDEEEDNTHEFVSGDLDSIFDDDNGNLYIEKKLRVDGDIETNEAYIKKTLYIPHPDTKVKTDIMELFKDWDARITQNTNDITNLKNRVNQCEIDIDNLESKVITIEGDITNIKGDITTINGYITTINNNITTINNNLTTINNTISGLTERVNELEAGDGGVTEEKVREIIEEATPIKILYAGELVRYQITSGYMWNNFGSINGKFKFQPENGNGGCADVKDGMMTLTLVSTDTNYYDPKILSVNVTQGSSRATGGELNTSIIASTLGAHWFQAQINGKYVRIREFHLTESTGKWQSSAFNLEDAVSSLNVTILGYQIKKS